MNDLALAVIFAVLGGYSFYAFKVADETRLVVFTAACLAVLYLVYVYLFIT